MSILFDPRDARCKSPFGAVTTFAAVDFTFYPHGHAVTSCTLLAHHEFSDRWTETELLPTTDEDGAPAFSGTFFAPSQPELIWYHFRLRWADGGESCYGKDGFQSWDKVTPWQLTVYDGRAKTPGWFGRGVTYQIFPDRFYRKKARGVDGLIGCRTLHERWDETPLCGPNERGDYCEDFFGGDLAGITEKLDYLSSLGVTTLYLCPIFEASTNHRYDTACYERIDPLLGTEEDFKKLCESAGRVGIKIILDGVFSHTGDDSRYFNRYSRYDTVGAYNSKSSPYFKWYKFDRYPDEYKSWWGFKTLPEVTEECPDYDEFICGKNGVIRKWLRLGASGWRLDVADELPDCFIDDLRVAGKTGKPDGILLGEVWEDATTKFSYGTRRRYLLGVQLDSVMNYPFAEAVTDFARNGVAESFESSVMTIIENYPKEALDVLMNHIGTHDTERAITKIAGEKSDYRDRQWQSEHFLSEEEYKRGVKLLKLCAAIQYTLPGVPCVYYGDEAGMQGYKDPFNRAFFPWGRENRELQNYYIRLGKVRRSTDCLKEGEFIPVSSVLSCVCFERRGKNDSCLLIANRNEQDITYYLPPRWQNTSEVLLGESVGSSVHVPGLSAVILKKEST